MVGSRLQWGRMKQYLRRVKLTIWRRVWNKIAWHPLGGATKAYSLAPDLAMTQHASFVTDHPPQRIASFVVH